MPLPEHYYQRQEHKCKKNYVGSMLYCVLVVSIEGIEIKQKNKACFMAGNARTRYAGGKSRWLI